jgi:hypothetical protein
METNAKNLPALADRNHEAARLLTEWKAAVPLAVDDAGRARLRDLADRFLEVRYRDGVRVTVTVSGGGLDLEVLSLGTRNGSIYVVPTCGIYSILRDDANDPRVVKL